MVRRSLWFVFSPQQSERSTLLTIKQKKLRNSEIKPELDRLESLKRTRKTTDQKEWLKSLSDCLLTAGKYITRISSDGSEEYWNLW